MHISSLFIFILVVQGKFVTSTPLPKSIHRSCSNDIINKFLPHFSQNDLDKEDKEGNTCLAYAVSYKRPEAAVLILKVCNYYFSL